MDEIRQLADRIDDIMAAQTGAAENETASDVDKKYLDQIKKVNARAVLLKAGLESLPDIPLADGTGMAPVQYLQLSLAEYISQYKKKSYEFAPLADEAASLLDREALAKTVAALYENATPESVQLTFLPAVFRFADGVTADMLYRRYKGLKWMEQTMNNCLMLSDTREAMILAEKNKLLDKYAAIRGADSDYIRYTVLYDFGFDTNGKKTYDLGSAKLDVILNNDLTLSLYDREKGKAVKSVPKKDTDPEMYAAANSDFSGMKKNLKKAVSSFIGRLFRMFLDGTGTGAEQWSSVYLKNPVLRQTAGLLVWSQGGRTFTLKDGTAIDSAGQPFAFGKEDIAVAHPMEMIENEVKAWQKYFIENSLRQPFEQIWEPVIDFENVAEDRYNNISIPAYRFKGQEKHGITFSFDFGGSDLYIELEDCFLEIYGGSAVGRHDLNLQGDLVLGNFKTKKSRASNHIIGLLDKWTIYGRILQNDMISDELLMNATPARIADYLKFASENNCVNVTALLMDYRNRTFADLDPMEEFTLDL